MCTSCYNQGYNDYPNYTSDEVPHKLDYIDGYKKRQNELLSDDEQENTFFCKNCYNNGKKNAEIGIWCPPDSSRIGHYDSYEKGYYNNEIQEDRILTDSKNNNLTDTSTLTRNWIKKNKKIILVAVTSVAGISCASYIWLHKVSTSSSNHTALSVVDTANGVKISTSNDTAIPPPVKNDDKNENLVANESKQANQVKPSQKTISGTQTPSAKTELASSQKTKQKAKHFASASNAYKIPDHDKKITPKNQHAARGNRVRANHSSLHHTNSLKNIRQNETVTQTPLKNNVTETLSKKNPEKTKSTTKSLPTKEIQNKKQASLADNKSNATKLVEEKTSPLKNSPNKNETTVARSTHHHKGQNDNFPHFKMIADNHPFASKTDDSVVTMEDEPEEKTTVKEEKNSDSRDITLNRNQEKLTRNDRKGRYYVYHLESDNDAGNTKEPYGGHFVFASRRSLKESDLQNRTHDELMIMLNEIYARHNMIFKDDSLRHYFVEKYWYNGELEDVAAFLSPVEKQNIEIIKKYLK